MRYGSSSTKITNYKYSVFRIKDNTVAFILYLPDEQFAGTKQHTPVVAKRHDHVHRQTQR